MKSTVRSHRANSLGAARHGRREASDSGSLRGPSQAGAQEADKLAVEPGLGSLPRRRSATRTWGQDPPEPTSEPPDGAPTTRLAEAPGHWQT